MNNLVGVCPKIFALESKPRTDGMSFFKKLPHAWCVTKKVRVSYLCAFDVAEDDSPPCSDGSVPRRSASIA